MERERIEINFSKQEIVKAGFCEPEHVCHRGSSPPRVCETADAIPRGTDARVFCSHKFLHHALVPKVEQTTEIMRTEHTHAG